jgi:hypothetical protein
MKENINLISFSFFILSIIWFLHFRSYVPNSYLRLILVFFIPLFSSFTIHLFLWFLQFLCFLFLHSKRVFYSLASTFFIFFGGRPEAAIRGAVSRVVKEGTSEALGWEAAAMERESYRVRDESIKRCKLFEQISDIESHISYRKPDRISGVFNARPQAACGHNLSTTKVICMRLWPLLCALPSSRVCSVLHCICNFFAWACWPPPPAALNLLQRQSNLPDNSTAGAAPCLDEWPEGAAGRGAGP